MFQLTHIYVTNAVLGNNYAALFGSTLLDLPIASKDYLSWQKFTGMQSWYSNIKNPDLKLGILSHAAVDFISHGRNLTANDGDGYSFEWFNDRFPQLRGMRGHNIPEYFLELYVAKRYPQVFELFEKATQTTDFAAVSRDIANATQKSAAKIENIVEKYVLFMRELNILTRLLSPFGNGQQGRAECLRNCVKECKKELEAQGLSRQLKP